MCVFLSAAPGRLVWRQSRWIGHCRRFWFKGARLCYSRKSRSLKCEILRCVLHAQLGLFVSNWRRCSVSNDPVLLSVACRVLQGSRWIPAPQNSAVLGTAAVCAVRESAFFKTVLEKRGHMLLGNSHRMASLATRPVEQTWWFWEGIWTCTLRTLETVSSDPTPASETALPKRTYLTWARFLLHAYSVGLCVQKHHFLLLSAGLWRWTHAHSRQSLHKEARPYSFWEGHQDWLHSHQGKLWLNSGVPITSMATGV